MSRGASLVLAVLILGPSLASAEFFVCGDGARPQCAQTQGLTQVLPSIDPSKVTDPTCSAVPEGQVGAQRTLLQTVAASHPHGRCHLKVVAGLAVEMLPAEKDTVNNAIALAAQPGQDMQDEVQNEDLCKSATLNIITQKMTNQRANLQTTFDTARASIQTHIDAVTQATIKTDLAAMFDTLFQALSAEADRTYTLIEKLARCDRARAGR